MEIHNQLWRFILIMDIHNLNYGEPYMPIMDLHNWIMEIHN